MQQLASHGIQKLVEAAVWHNNPEEETTER